jgi:hypothetical protein
MEVSKENKTKEMKRIEVVINLKEVMFKINLFLTISHIQ